MPHDRFAECAIPEGDHGRPAGGTGYADADTPTPSPHGKRGNNGKGNGAGDGSPNGKDDTNG